MAAADEPVAPAKPTDADLFFTEYRKAVRQFDPRTPEPAALTLDLLAKKLTTSPWLEIALLKGAELLEATNPTAAQEAYEVLRQRLGNAPYFQGDAERARLFRVVLGGAVDNGLLRVRTARVRAGLQRYFSKYLEYPESLAKLAVLQYVEQEDIVGPDGQPLRYIPAGIVMRPFISYKRFEGLTTTPPEPLVVNHPRVDAMSQVEDDPPRWAAMLVLSGRGEVVQARVDQTLQGYLVAATARDGAIVCNPQRVLVLLTPDGK